MRGSVRALLALDAIAATSVMAVLTLVVGLPLAARRALAPYALVWLVVAAVVPAAVAGTLLLWRSVARPVERMLQVARGIGPRGADGLPILGEDQGEELSRASVLFGRVVAELVEERGRLAAKIVELGRADSALDDARAHLARSERLATMGRLAAGLAHEIGNPLGAVCGYAEVARARVPAGASPELADALSRISDAAARIDGILRELLEFARPSPPRLGPVAVGPVIDAAVRLGHVQQRFRRVEVALAVAAGLPLVRGDEGRLVQVLLNLLLNAGDAMCGEGRVEIAASADEAGGVVIAVTDSGPGIAPEHLPHLFEPFFTTKAPGEGTGLGLAISHRIVEELGGVLTAENGAAGGAVFRLRLAPVAAGPSGGPPGGP